MGNKQKGYHQPSILDFHITKRPRTLCFKPHLQSTQKEDGILMIKSTHQMMLNQNQLSLPPKKRFRPSINQQQEEAVNTLQNFIIPTKRRRTDLSSQDLAAAETLLFLRNSVPTINNNSSRFIVSAIPQAQEQIQKKLPSLDSIINNNNKFNAPAIIPQIQEQIRKKLPSLDSSQLSQNITNKFNHFFAAGNQILSDLKVVIVKHLEMTDVKETEARLSMPKSSVMSKFLTDEEEIKLQKREPKAKKERIEVRVRGTRSQQDYNLGLTRWYYQSNKGWSYALNHGWNRFKNENGLQQGDLILVVAFRSEEGKLCLAIIDNK